MDTSLRILGALANIASIITAAIAGAAAFWYLYRRRQKRLRLENYLKAEAADNDRLHGLTHLAAELGLTEAEIVDLAFRSRPYRKFGLAKFHGFAPKAVVSVFCKKIKLGHYRRLRRLACDAPTSSFLGEVVQNPICDAAPRKRGRERSAATWEGEQGAFRYVDGLDLRGLGGR
jgi:hypothetical protein